VDKKPIDPPPVIQIALENDGGNLITFQDFLFNPFFMMSVTLVHPIDDEEIKYPSIPETTNKQVTTGSIVSSMYRLKDINNHEGGFFIFPNICVRMEGLFRLRCSFFEIDG